MENRIESRRKDFKKSFDDPRRRREDAQLQIRKSTREAHLAKKRADVVGSYAATEGDISAAGYGTGVDGQGQQVVLLSDLPKFVQALHSDEPERIFYGAHSIRRLLSVEKRPPIQQVIDSGIMERLVTLLGKDEYPELQFEIAWALTNIASGTQEQTEIVVRSGALPIFVHLLQSEKSEVREQAIWALGNVAGDSAEFRNMVLDAGALPLILNELQAASKDTRGEVRLSLIRYATWTLSNLCRGKPEPPFELLSQALPVLRTLLYASDTEILTDACWALSYLSDAGDDNAERWITEVIKSGVCWKLVQLLGHSSFLVQTPALRTVGNIVTGDDSQTETMLGFGVLEKLKKLLESPRKALKKEACWAISNITAGNRDQIEAVLAANIIPDLVKLLDTGEFEIKREAAWAISNAASGGNTRQVQALVQAGCLKPLVALLEVHDAKIVSVALEAIENILKTGKTLQEEENLQCNPYVEPLDKAGGFGPLERLSGASTGRTPYLAIRIMQNYLELENDEEQAFAAKTINEVNTFGEM